MFQKQVLNLGSVFPFCYFLLLAHCNFPFVYKQFMNVSSVEIELSRSAWSTFFSWCKDSSLGCCNIKNEMDFTMPRKSPCKLLPDPKRPPNNQSFKKKTHVFSLYSRAVQQRFGDSYAATDSWHAAPENDTAEGRTAIHPRPEPWCSRCKTQLVLPTFLCFWPKHSYTFPSPVPWKLFESLLISHSGLAERENGRRHELVVGGLCLSDMLGDGEGRASHPFPTISPLPSHALPTARVQNQL